MTTHLTTYKKNTGFTLIEVMLVIVLVGMMVSVVQFSFSGDKPEEKLKNSAQKFAGVFEVASEYGMLNNVELGLFITENSYRFLGYDGTRWTDIPGNDVLAEQQLPQGIEIVLELDDLPIEEPQLLDAEVFREQQENYQETLTTEQEKEKSLIPQVYILSGGDLTPFSLTFKLEDNIALLEDIRYQVTGLYTTPLMVERLSDE